jgi:hypothetical protein
MVALFDIEYVSGIEAEKTAAQLIDALTLQVGVGTLVEIREAAERGTRNEQRLTEEIGWSRETEDHLRQSLTETQDALRYARGDNERQAGTIASLREELRQLRQADPSQSAFANIASILVSCTLFHRDEASREAAWQALFVAAKDTARQIVAKNEALRNR